MKTRFNSISVKARNAIQALCNGAPMLLMLSGMLWASTPAQAQEQNGVPFNGIVTDIAGNPLRGVRIWTVSQQFFARSDKQGRFGLTDVLPTDTLHIRYRKMRYDIAVEGRKSIRIHLGDQLKSEEDEELVNWGYGFVSKRESLEVSSGISGEVLRRTGCVNLLDALKGQIPGMSVTSSGRPGEEPQAIIRGINTLNASTEPLYIVDGTVVPSLEFVNINDVERVEVLKDATIYGSRGSNGAILVTMRRGPSTNDKH